jgi:CRP-like cAMP-binding protein
MILEDDESDKDMDEEEKKPEQEEVAKIETLGFFGEGALIFGEEIELFNATVTVSSEKCVLLRLKRLNFLKLMETNTTFTRTEENNKEGDDNKSIIEQMKETRQERSQLNQMLMQNRNSSDLLGSGGSTNTRSLFYDSGLANTSTTGVDS